jgi:dTMP kinase
MVGRLIVIEGLDGTGKATQTKLLLKKLKKEKYQTAVFDFPQYSKFFGKLVGSYLRGEFGQAHEVSPYFASMLYALDRSTVVDRIKGELKKNKIVICNRYSTANFLHQTGKIKDKNKKNKFLKWLEYLEFDFLKIPQPDLVLFLDLPPHLGQQLVKKKNKRAYLNGKKHDIHEKSSSHLKDAMREASQLIKRFNWQKIDCLKDKKLLSKEEIADKIWLIVKNNAL